MIVDVTNIGTEAIGYSACDGHANLTVPGGRHKQTPKLRGCYTGFGGGSGCGIDHPPLMAPGQTVSLRYLLKGYRLQSGTHVLRASGRAGVRWFFGWDRNSSPVSERKIGDSYVDDAAIGSGMTEPSRQAREAIAEMAPPLLEKTILEFANQLETAALAVEGLGKPPRQRAGQIWSSCTRRARTCGCAL